MTRIKNTILAGLAFGLLFGAFFVFLFGADHALITASIAALLFGAGMYFFVTSKTVKRQTQIEDSDGRVIVHSGDANHFMKGEAVGGKLYLLTDKLQFQSHKFNIQNHRLIIEIEQIKEVGFYNTLGFVPNGLAIITMGGQTEKFVVNGRRHWKEEIEKLKDGIK